MADENLKEELERLRAENERLKKRSSRGVTMKVSEKGGLSVYGLGRFPVTLYKEQWVRLLDKRPMRKVLQFESFKWADHFAAQRRKSIEVNPKKIEALRGILRLCREKNIHLYLCIPPNHAAYLSAMRLNGDPDPAFRVDRSHILAVLAEEQAAHPGTQVDLWDFNDFHPLNCEPLPAPTEQHTYFWADGTHALPPLGHIMLARMLGWPVPDARGADYGVKLTPGDLEARLRQIDGGYPRYQAEHADDFGWVREHLRDFEKR